MALDLAFMPFVRCLYSCISPDLGSRTAALCIRVVVAPVSSLLALVLFFSPLESEKDSKVLVLLLLVVGVLVAPL